ncbi:MAG TPA: sugar phosphate isomerase/epimerase family protein [Bryobacteraceae bacterium]|nr:sugar phosphate isomerase/epimerase family protein [Bryobacteraceae bacterium]
MQKSLSRRACLKLPLAAVASRLAAADASTDAHGFKLGIITDELTGQLNEALDFVSSYHLRWCELREMWGKNIMNSSRDELDRARDLIERHGVRVSEIASPLFKWNCPQMPAKAGEKRDTFAASFAEQDADKLLAQSFELARFFGTRMVRIFTYWRVDDPTKAYPYVRDRMAKAAEVAARSNIILNVENEHSCNVGTGKELGRLLRDVNSPSLRGVWDPANATMLGEVPFPDGYAAVKGLFPHMHVKDSRKNATTGELEWAPVGGGIVDFKGQFQALLRDRYEGTISLETHYRRPDGNKVESTRESLVGLFKVLGEV